MSEYSEIGTSSLELDFGVTVLDEATEIESDTANDKVNDIVAVPEEKTDDSNLPSVAPSSTSNFGNRIKKLLPQRSPNKPTSLLHYKLQEANQQLWNAFHSPPQTVSKDIQTTMERIGLRLDKTQHVTVENSNHVRSAIGNLKTCLKLSDSLVNDCKKFLPFAEATTCS